MNTQKAEEMRGKKSEKGKSAFIYNVSLLYINKHIM